MRSEFAIVLAVLGFAITIFLSCADNPALGEYPSIDYFFQKSSSSMTISSSSAESSSSVEKSSSSSLVLSSSSSLVLSSSSSLALSSSSSLALSSSSSLVLSSSSSNLCTGFINDTLRKHLGQDKPQFCDSRDGKKYVYVKITANDFWMAENLNYDAAGSLCYNDVSSNCTTYGKLYSSTTNVCPEGWHIPTSEEWRKAINPSCYNTSCIGAATLKANGMWGKEYQDRDGFSAMPAGYYFDGFQGLNSYSKWWDSEGNIWTMNSNNEYMTYESSSKTIYISIRCVKQS